MGYFILAPVLLADYKSAIVTCTAADCKSAETEREKAQDRRRITNPPKLDSPKQDSPKLVRWGN